MVKFMNLRKFYKISENFCLSEASFHILLEARRVKNELGPKGLSVRSKMKIRPKGHHVRRRPRIWKKRYFSTCFHASEPILYFLLIKNLSFLWGVVKGTFGTAKSLALDEILG